MPAAPSFAHVHAQAPHAMGYCAAAHGMRSQLSGKLQSLHDRGTRGTGSSAHLPLLREVLQLLDVPLAQPVPQLHGLLLPKCGQLPPAAAAWQLCLPLQGQAALLSTTAVAEEDCSIKLKTRLVTA